MAYGIPQETIEQVRMQADIVQVISEYVTLTKAGSRYKACCPFHEEKTPSFMVSPDKQLYHCFGCKAGGNVFGFLMRQEGFTFAEAVRFLAERVGVQIKQTADTTGEKELRERLFDLYEFARAFYQKGLLKSPQAEHARKYLQDRQLPEEAIKSFSLGYAPGGWDIFLSAASKKGFQKELLLQGGLAKKNPEGRVYDTFRNRVMFPIWGLTGKVIAFGARALGEDQPKYINSPETAIYQKGQTLYNLARAKKSISNKDSVIVVEGYTDLIRLVLNGIENVVASLGTAFTNAQARLLKRYTDEIVLVFDSDSAGVSAAGRGIETLLSQDIGVKVAALPAGKDPDEFVLDNGSEAFGEIIKEARNFIEFHVENALAASGGDELDNKIKTANTLAELVSKIPDPIRKEEYLRILASRLGLKPETLLQASQKKASTDRIERELKRPEKSLKNEEKRALWLLKLMMSRPEEIGKVRAIIDMASIEDKALKELFGVLLDLEDKQFDEGLLFDRIQTEEGQQLLSNLSFEAEAIESAEYVDWPTDIDITRVRREEKKTSTLQEQIAEAERAGDIELLSRLLKQKVEGKRGLQNIIDDRANVPAN